MPGTFDIILNQRPVIEIVLNSPTSIDVVVPSLQPPPGDSAVDSVNGYTGDVVLTKSDIGLGNVNNTSDANKPISTATQTALDAKADLQSTLLTGGVISVGTYGGSGTNNDIRVTASTFFIINSGNHSAVQTDFLDIALSSSGTQRYIGLYGTTSNTISKVEGSEAALATFPTQPANTALIGYVLVSDASVSTTPDLSGYLLRADKATAASVSVATNDDTYVTPYSMRNKVTSWEHTCSTGFSPVDNDYYYFAEEQNAATNSASPIVSNIRDVSCPVTGTIIAAVVSTRVTNSASSEAVEWIFRNTTTGNNHTITTTGFNLANGVNVFKKTVITGLSIAVTQGDLSLTLFKGNWATNPTGVIPQVYYIIRT